MIDLIVGIGQGGCRLAKEFSQGLDAQAVYCNLTNTDFSKLDVSRKDKFVIEVGGTGKDPEYGEHIVRKHIANYKKFLGNYEAETVMVVVGGGGGSGAGFLPHTLKYFTGRKRVILVFILPEENEGIPTKPNALKTLNKVITEYRQKISICLVDNEYLGKVHGHSGSNSYWESVNRAIVGSFKKIYLLTNLEKNKNYIDVSSGFKALDEKDVQRVLFTENGYVDIRELVLPATRSKAGDCIKREFGRSSMFMPDLDSRSAGRCFIALGIPGVYKDHKEHVMKYVSGIFSDMSAVIRTPDVVRCNYYNNKLAEIKLLVGMAGITANSRMKKLVASVNRDLEKMESCEGLSVIDF
jgi:hypothetical protein